MNDCTSGAPVRIDLSAHFKRSYFPPHTAPLDPLGVQAIGSSYGYVSRSHYGWHYTYPPRPDSDDLEVLGGATYCLGVGASVMPGIDIMKPYIHKTRRVSERASIIP